MSSPIKHQRTKKHKNLQTKDRDNNRCYDYCRTTWYQRCIRLSPDHLGHVGSKGGVQRLEGLPPLHRVLLVPRQRRIVALGIPAAACQVKDVHLDSRRDQGRTLAGSRDGSSSNNSQKSGHKSSHTGTRFGFQRQRAQSLVLSINVCRGLGISPLRI